MKLTSARPVAYCLILLLMPLRTTFATEPVRLNVLSYNVHHCEGSDRQLDLERIVRVIKSVQPDLVSLQEVDRNVGRTQTVNQPDELARLTDLQVAFGPNIDLQGGTYGNAILSRYPIISHTNHRLPNINSGEQRGVLQAEIDVPGLSESLILLTTHFDHRPDDQERVASAKAINAMIAGHQRNALLMGDLNDVQGSPALLELERLWTLTNDDPLPTIPVDKPSRQIDFVLFRPRQNWRVVETRVLDEAVASDHRAIFAILEQQSP